jgi:lysozyme
MNKNYYKVIVLLLITLFIPIGLCTYYGIKQKQSSITTNRRKPDPQKCAHPDGIDLSHHNIAYDWKKVDAKFVYVRATFGVTIKDRRYHIHRKAAERHQIPVGAYHFLTAETSAKEQFLHFSSVVKKKHIRLRPMLDVEESKYWNAPKGFSDMDAHLFIREWCDLCKKKYGVAPIIYTTEKLYERYGLNKDFEDCIWWVANYNDVKNYKKKCIIPYTIHQYSHKQFVEGFYGYVDCNRFSTGKTVDDLRLK